MSKKKPTKIYTEKDAHGAASKFGQIIGEEFADVVLKYIDAYLSSTYEDYVLLPPEQGKKLVKLEMAGGTLRQIDNVIAPRNSKDPVALLESKWLKDARHHNDKGAWILQLREIQRRKPTVRGLVAILVGYWSDAVGVMFQSEAGVKMVWIATDAEVYSTLQNPVNQILQNNNLEPFIFDPIQIRDSLDRPWDIANALTTLKTKGALTKIAEEWIRFRRTDENGNSITGGDLISKAVDEVLAPLPKNPSIANFDISLRINTGNIIHDSFSDLEDAIEFIQKYFSDSKVILEKITPEIIVEDATTVDEQPVVYGINKRDKTKPSKKTKIDYEIESKSADEPPTDWKQSSLFDD